MRAPFLFALTACLLALTAATLWMTRGPAREGNTTEMAADPALANLAPSYGAAAIGGEYTLTDQHGNTIDSSRMHGRLQLVFFGFTHCPDICPVSLVTVTDVLNALGPQASRVQPVFITLDPARDTPDVLRQYVGNFHPSFLALTGTEEQVRKAASAYKVYYAKNGGDTDGDYSVDHSGFIYLMDEKGQYLAHFRHDDPTQKILDAVRTHLK